MMQIDFGQTPPFFWWFVAAGILILFVALGAAPVIRAIAVLVDARGRVRVRLAALQAHNNSEDATDSGNGTN